MNVVCDRGGRSEPGGVQPCRPSTARSFSPPCRLPTWPTFLLDTSPYSPTMPCTFYLTLFYDPSSTHNADAHGVHEDVVALRVPPRRNRIAPVDAHTFRCAWPLPAADHGVRYPHSCVALQAVRKGVARAMAKQERDEEFKETMKKLGL